MHVLTKAAVGTGVAALLFTGVMGFAHTRAGRPILKFLGMGCPVQAKPEQVQAGLQRGLAGLRGDGVAPERFALGLNLDATTLSDAQAWASGHHLDCKVEKHGLSSLHCEHVPAEVLAPGSAAVDDLQLTFSLADRLIAVDLFRGRRSSVEAAALYASARASLQARLGPPTEEQGQSSAEYLAAGTMHLAQLRYRYRDYVAQVTAANLGDHGVAEREVFQSATF